MGALLSQAVANQLRQVPGFQDPRPSPSTLIQQVLNPPGPSMPTWMAGPMESQQLLATNTPEATQAFTQDALRTALAFGGADITKEQRAAWEAENRAYKAATKWLPEKSYQVGTRVKFRPLGTRISGELGEPSAFHEGTVVTPGTPEAGAPGQLDYSPRWATEPPSPEYIAVKPDDSKWWFWRHRDTLEVLPPLEHFPVGSEVGYKSQTGAIRYEGQVAEPPRTTKSPGPEWVWVDIHTGTPRSRTPVTSLPYDFKVKGVVRYPASDMFGAWFHRRDLELLKKK